ncbi:MAG: DUF6265 family protein [Rubricoccaceae bacterium]|nr:DUF6265 family protein [Rubricoccaceae bacterium]
MHFRLLLTAASLFLSSSLFAQTENTLTLGESETGQEATIDDVAFLTGHWQGEGMGGFNEEVWGEPLGGSMLGTFRHLQNDEPSFSEIMQISEEEGSLALRLKHFNPDLTGWEEKDDMVTFPLVRIEPGEVAYFRGLTYRLVSENELMIYLALHSRGQVREVAFEFHRVGE